MSVSGSIAAVITETKARLEPQLGKLVIHDEPNDTLAVAIPGSDYPVIIQAHDGPAGLVLGVGSLIAKTVDWSIQGISTFCLRESSGLIFGNIELCADGLVIDQVIFADASGEQLTALIFTIARSAARIRSDLDRMGAMTLPEEAA